jgi:tetratricopeptide (TPR) repeat protein
VEEDPEKAYSYTQAAKRLAARVGVVREACGIAAYRTGRWAEALSELRAARRMTGHDEYLPLMADCERALGRPDRALALVHEAKVESLSRAMQIELHIVESGIRRDQGLADAAVLVLQVPELTSGRLRPWSARLFYAYADALLAAGRMEEARNAFARAAEADTGGETDASERLDELDGIEFEDLAESEDFDDDEDLEDLGDLADLEVLDQAAAPDQVAVPDEDATVPDQVAVPDGDAAGPDQVAVPDQEAAGPDQVVIPDDTEGPDESEELAGLADTKEPDETAKAEEPTETGDIEEAPAE